MPLSLSLMIEIINRQIDLNIKNCKSFADEGDFELDLARPDY